MTDVGGNFFTTWNVASGAICWAWFRGAAERAIDAGIIRVRDSGCGVARQFRGMELILTVVAANNYFTAQRVTCARKETASRFQAGNNLRREQRRSVERVVKKQF